MDGEYPIPMNETKVNINTKILGCAFPRPSLWEIDLFPSSGWDRWVMTMLPLIQGTAEVPLVPRRETWGFFVGETIGVSINGGTPKIIRFNGILWKISITNYLFWSTPLETCVWVYYWWKLSTIGDQGSRWSRHNLKREWWPVSPTLHPKLGLGCFREILQQSPTVRQQKNWCGISQSHQRGNCHFFGTGPLLYWNLSFSCSNLWVTLIIDRSTHFCSGSPTQIDSEIHGPPNSQFSMAFPYTFSRPSA